MNESLARAAIKAVLESVSDIGQVHDYERYADDWEDFISLFLAENIGADDEKMLRGWTISLQGIPTSDQITFGSPGASGTTQVDYSYVIRGYHAVKDETASEKEWITLCAAVKTALDADTSLHSGVYDDGANGNFVSGKATMRTDFRMFSEILCHYTEIVLPVTEVV